MSCEKWANVAGYEGLYQISSSGRVKSMERKALKPHNGTYQTIREKILKPVRRSDNNYYSVSLCKDGISKLISVHRLVAEAFLPNPENKAHVNHLDGDKLNNRLDNLVWATEHENKVHAVYSGLVWPTYGMRPVRCVNDGKLYQSVSLAGQHYDINSSTISKVCRGKQGHAHGLRFAYVD